MTIIFRQLFKLIYLLHSETATHSISIGIVCGLFLGFSPVISLQSIIVILCLLLFRIQFGATLLSMAFFKLCSPLLEGIFHYVGDFVLSLEFLEPAFTSIYNMPLIPYTRFYNSVVLGSGLIAVVLAGPIFWISELLVERYRETVVSKFKQSSYWKYWKTTSLYRWYISYSTMID